MAAIVRKKCDQAINEVSFDDLLTSAGEWGRYQWFLLVASSPYFAFGVFSALSQIFITQTPSNYWCRIPELANLSDFERRDLGVPKDSSARFGYSQCEMYSVNWTYMLQINGKPNKTWDTMPCQYGWEFNKSEIPYPTVGSDFGWVCEKTSYQATAQVMYFVGSVFGGIIFGWVADRFGRIPAITSSCLVGCVGGASSAFARNSIQFISARFVMGMSFSSCMVMAYILILEYIAPKYKTVMANTTFSIFYTLFSTALPWVALACGHWKTICLVTSLPLGLGIFTKLFLPESPRWLISKGKINEAIEKVLVIGRANNKEIPRELIHKFNLTATNTNTPGKKVSDILKRPVYRKIYIFMCLEYLCSICVFDGIVRCIGLFNFDFFISFSVIAVSFFPSVIIAALTMDYIGRRWMCVVSLGLSSIFFVLIIFASNGLQSLIFAVITTLATNMLYIALLQWASEILPSSVRGSGLALIHISGLIGAFMSQYIVNLEVYYYWLPLGVFGAISVLGMLIAFALPETAMMSMPNTFEEAEDIINNQRIWSLPYLEARKKKNEQLRRSNLSL